jgi:hypothetical protein
MKRFHRFFLRVFFSFSLAALLVACYDSSLNEAGAFASKIMGASDFDVKKINSGSGTIYELTALEASWNASYANADVMSVGALAFFNQINDNSEKSYVRLIVKTEGDVYRQTYTSEELRRADRCIDRVGSFFNWNPVQGVDSLRPLIDPAFFPDSLIMKIGASIQQQDSLDNGFVRAELVGFEADTLAGISVLTVKVNCLRKQNRQRYDAFVGLSDERLLLVVPSEK